ncbi:UdgX family uracil-DNA binding protein [Rhizobium sp. Root482]|uniref:UdgX family uracil-DNA binding protein n=1 Tax=Rhizobium sp. Root482 TaxID=1736543 RepID=UPI0009E9EB62|nr:UdgX family uracil-DNA binding protein [Rhizobium sp. Root482]
MTALRAPKLPPVFGTDHAEGSSLGKLHHDAEDCRRCDLYRDATQVVFGEGPKDAAVVLVGEQPGDHEDLAGRPFVGPAGRLLDECLHEAEIDRSLCYVTNAVKHFKFELRGKRRLHTRPNAGEIKACAFWLGGELDLIRPSLIVALGATALYSLMGRSVGLTKRRGEVLETVTGTPLLVTIHPSYLLRIRSRGDAAEARRHFISDLEQVKSYLPRQEQ